MQTLRGGVAAAVVGCCAKVGFGLFCRGHGCSQGGRGGCGCCKCSGSEPVPMGKGKGKDKAASYTYTSVNKNKAKAATQTQQILPPITDETVLQTLLVTLHIEGLVNTISEMYHQAVTEASNSNAAMQSVEANNEFRNILEEVVCVHFKAVCDCSPIHKTDDAKPDSYWLQEMQMQQKLTKYYEQMQSTCLQLAKHLENPCIFNGLPLAVCGTKKTWRIWFVCLIILVIKSNRMGSIVIG